MAAPHDSGRTVFVEGALPDALVLDLLGPLPDGGQTTFLGRVRPDLHGERRVISLEYEAYREMAVPVLDRVLAEVADEYGLTNLRARHSLGRVAAGEICFAVVATAVHRVAAFAGCQAAVERIKEEVPIFAKEELDDGSHRWKRNT